MATAKLDEYWSHLRLTNSGLIGSNLLKQDYQPNVFSASGPNRTLAQSPETYLVQKDSNRGKIFYTTAQRACTYLVDACGAKDLGGYSRADALKYRDYLIAKGMAGSSVSRVMSSSRAE